jgi:DNA-directed RNA polymerase specialized sigma24 family protein
MSAVRAAGDPAPGADEAVTALYQAQYCGLVRLAALLTGDTSAAEAVVQDAFAAMHGAWHRLGEPGAALGYLRRSVVSRSRRISPLPVPPVPADNAGMGGEAEQQAVLTAIRALPQRQREVLVLRYYLDLPDGEIALATGLRAVAVGDLAGRALAVLRGGRP